MIGYIVEIYGSLIGFIGFVFLSVGLVKTHEQIEVESGFLLGGNEFLLNSFFKDQKFIRIGLKIVIISFIYDLTVSTIDHFNLNIVSSIFLFLIPVLLFLWIFDYLVIRYEEAKKIEYLKKRASFVFEQLFFKLMNTSRRINAQEIQDQLISKNFVFSQEVNSLLEKAKKTDCGRELYILKVLDLIHRKYPQDNFNRIQLKEIPKLYNKECDIPGRINEAAKHPLKGDLNCYTFSIERKVFDNLVVLDCNETGDFTKNPRTLREVSSRIARGSLRDIAQKYPWYQKVIFIKGEFDYNKLDPIIAVPLNNSERDGSPGGSFYIHEGSHSSIALSLKLLQDFPYHSVDLVFIPNRLELEKS